MKTQRRTSFGVSVARLSDAARCSAAIASAAPWLFPAIMRADVTTGFASTSAIQKIAKIADRFGEVSALPKTDRASILAPIRNAHPASVSITLIAVAPDAVRYAMAAFVFGDLAGARPEKRQPGQPPFEVNFFGNVGLAGNAGV